MKTKENRGGRRTGAGNPGTPRVDEPKKGVTIQLRPSVVKKFKEKHGRRWNGVVQDLMEKDAEKGS